MANTVELTGFLNKVKTLSSGMNVASFSVSTKVSGNGTDAKYKNGYINVISKQPLTEGAKVTIKGFITFDFWEDKDTGKERNAMKIFVNEIE